MHLDHFRCHHCPVGRFLHPTRLQLHRSYHAQHMLRKVAQRDRQKRILFRSDFSVLLYNSVGSYMHLLYGDMYQGLQQETAWNVQFRK